MEALYLRTNNINVFHHLLNEVCACCLQVLWLFLVYACISRKLWKFLGLLFLSSACDVVFLCFLVFFSSRGLLSSFSLDGFSLYFLKRSGTGSRERLQRCRSWSLHPKAVGGRTNYSQVQAWELSLHQCQQLLLSCLQGSKKFIRLSCDF